MSSALLELGSPTARARALQKAVADVVPDAQLRDTLTAITRVEGDLPGGPSLVEQRIREAAREQPRANLPLRPPTELSATELLARIVGVYVAGLLLGLVVSDAVYALGDRLELGPGFRFVEATTSVLAVVAVPVAYLVFLWTHREGAPRRAPVAAVQRLDRRLDETLRIHGLAIPEEADRNAFLSRLQRAVDRLDGAVAAFEEASHRLDALVRSQDRVAQALRTSGLRVVVHGVDVGPGAPIDHVVLGPCAAAIESVPGRGRLGATQDDATGRLLVELDLTPLEGEPGAHAARAADHLTRTLGVRVTPVLCVADAVGGPLLVGGVVLCNAAQLPVVVRSLPPAAERVDPRELADRITTKPVGAVDPREAGLSDGDLAAFGEARHLMDRLRTAGASATGPTSSASRRRARWS